MAKKKHRHHHHGEVEIVMEVDETNAEVVDSPFLAPLSLPKGAPAPQQLPPSTAKHEMPVLALNGPAPKPLFPMPGAMAPKLVIPVTAPDSRPSPFGRPIPEPESVSFKFPAIPGVRFYPNADGFEVRVNKENVADFYDWINNQLDEQLLTLGAPKPPAPRRLNVEVTESGEVKVTRRT